MQFADVQFGQLVRLCNFIGYKIEPIFPAGAREFYKSQGHDFQGYNFHYQFQGVGEWNVCGVKPDTEVVLL